MDLSKKEIKGCLINISNNERFEFQFNPEAISDSKVGEFAINTIPNTNLPHYQFISGGIRKISFELKLYGKDSKKKVEWLQSLQQINPNSNQPCKVLFMFGDLYETMKCVVKEVNTVHHTLFTQDKLLPHVTTAAINLEQCS